jgi:hypothetical protein
VVHALIVLQEMKTLITLILLTCCHSFVEAEEVEVFACDTQSHDIEWDEEGTEQGDEGTKTFLTFHRVGKLLGKIDTGKVFFSDIAEEAAAYDSSSDPFFGPGTDYIVKDSKGHHYVLFFEYKEGDRTFTGFRMAINSVTLVDPKLKVFEGSPFSGESSGRSFDEGFLARLKDLTKKAESGPRE